MVANNKRLILIIAICSLLLLVPFLGMYFSSEIQWESGDFFAAGVLLFGTGLSCELILRNVKKTSYRIIICLVILAILLLVWTELAVGIFGSPFTGH